MKKSTKIALIILCVATLLGIIFRILSGYYSQQASKIPNFDNSTTNFARVTWTGEPISVPTDLPVYQGGITRPPLQQFVEPLLAAGDFTQNPYTSTIFHSKTGTLQIVESDHLLAFTRAQNAPSEDSFGRTSRGDFEESQAKAAALAFLSDALGIQADGLELTSARFYQSDENPDQVEPSLASFVQLTFSPKLNGIPVVTALAGTETVRAAVDRNYQVLMIKVDPQEVTTSSSTRYPTFSMEEAIANINKNQAFIGNASWETSGGIALEQIRSATLTNGRLEYYIPQNSQTLVPYYRLWGTAVDATGKNIIVDILTPAVDQDAKPIE